MTKEKIKKELSKLQRYMDNLLPRDYCNEICDEIEFLDFENSNADDWYLQERFNKIFSLMCDLHYEIEYLKLPVRSDGFLVKNNRGRYELNDFELTSGCALEIKIYDDFHECEKWVKTRLEHNGTDYYFVGYKDYSVSNRHARIRRK